MRDNSFGLIGRRRLLGITGAVTLTAIHFATDRSSPRSATEPSRLATATRDRHWNREAEQIRTRHQELLIGYANTANGIGGRR